MSKLVWQINTRCVIFWSEIIWIWWTYEWNFRSITVIGALAFNRMISTSENNELVYEADFVDGKVKERRFDCYGNPFPSSTQYDLKEGLSRAKRLAKVRITNAKEMYDVLTDEKQLALVLNEGLDPEHQHYKDQMIEFFTGMRDRFAESDLHMTSYYGGTGKSNVCSICDGFGNIHCVNCQQRYKSTCLR